MKQMEKWSGVVTLCLMIAGFAYLAGAEDKKPDAALAQYLEQLQTKLDHTARRVNQPGSEGSSVVGLRGSKQESASKQLYWKGKQGRESVTPEEIRAFRSAVEQARAGKNADAVTSLKAFQEKYPKSALLPDVQETLAHLNTPTNP